MTGRWFHDTLGTPTQGTLLPLLFDVKYLDFETFCGGVQCSILECWRCGWSSGPSSWATARRRRSGRAEPQAADEAGGPGEARTTGFVGSLGFRPARVWAALAVGGELAAGFLFL